MNFRIWNRLIPARSKLLRDINFRQKSWMIYKMLNSLINKEHEADDLSQNLPKIDSKHIMLIDDDSLTNKLHHHCKHNKNKRVVQFGSSIRALDYLKKISLI
ncbi:hypothetical protein CS542_02550 [Pedobacter sp. IW39]|nr:hypothetical protein CS542_02550 [Pedobacter sp. IW39]